MTALNRNRRKQKPSERRGASVVECAFVSPLLVLLLMGSIDVGQFANVYQKISDASREGARFAARYDTATVAQVEAVVNDYLENALSGTSAATLASAVEVEVTDSEGAAIAGGDMTSIDSGSPINVTVSLQFDQVRWSDYLAILDGRTISLTTTMRRE